MLCTCWQTGISSHTYKCCYAHSSMEHLPIALLDLLSVNALAFFFFFYFSLVRHRFNRSHKVELTVQQAYIIINAMCKFVFHIINIIIILLFFFFSSFSTFFFRSFRILFFHIVFFFLQFHTKLICVAYFLLYFIFIFVRSVVFCFVLPLYGSVSVCVCVCFFFF